LRLTILGGGGFRVPLVYGALLGGPRRGARVTHVVLHDPGRGTALRRGPRPRRAGGGRAGRARGDRHHRSRRGPARRRLRLLRDPRRVASKDARRTSGSRSTRASSARRRSARAASRTACARCPSPSDIAHRVARLAPTPGSSTSPTPAGLVTEAMSRHLGDRVIGHLRLTGRPRPPYREGPRRRPARGLDRLRRPQPPRLGYGGPARRGPRRTPAPARRPAGCSAPSRRASSSAPSGSSPWGRSRTSTCTTTTSTANPSAPTRRRRRRAAPSSETSRPTSTREMKRPDAGALTAWDRTRAGARGHVTCPRTGRRPARAERDADDLSGGYEKVALALMRAIARDETHHADPSTSATAARWGPARRGGGHRGAVPRRRQRCASRRRRPAAGPRHRLGGVRGQGGGGGRVLSRRRVGLTDDRGEGLRAAPARGLRETSPAGWSTDTPRSTRAWRI